MDIVKLITISTTVMVISIIPVANISNTTKQTNKATIILIIYTAKPSLAKRQTINLKLSHLAIDNHSQNTT